MAYTNFRICRQHLKKKKRKTFMQKKLFIVIWGTKETIKTRRDNEARKNQT